VLSATILLRDSFYTNIHVSDEVVSLHERVGSSQNAPNMMKSKRSL